MKRNISTLSAIAALLVCGSVANAHDVALPGTIEIPAGNPGYVNVGGNALRTGGGECLKLGTFSEETQVNACEGIEETAEVEAEPEPEAAPEPEPAPAPEPVEKEPIVATATLGGEALFDSGSSELNASSEQAMTGLITKLAEFQEITSIEVVGHADAAGDEGFNQQLSEQRAKSVENYLKAAYPDVNITSKGLGESSPIATNSTPEGRAQNRRVEVQITAKSITE